MASQIEINEQVAERLKDEDIIWLTSVTAKGTPQPAPVWFLWDAETFLIYSRFDALRNRNVEQNSKVALNLNSNERGGAVVILWGEATIEADAPLAQEVPAYLEKYQEGIGRIGMTPESFSTTYSVAIRVKPTRIKAF